MNQEKTEKWSAKEAAALFKSWRDGPPMIRQEDAAKTFGVAQQTISSWARGKTPGLAHRIRLKMVCGIAPELWLSPEMRSTGKFTPDEERELVAHVEATGTDGGQ
jgi:transcriptional regulator with XRE-family HTH domain